MSGAQTQAKAGGDVAGENKARWSTIAVVGTLIALAFVAVLFAGSMPAVCSLCHVAEHADLVRSSHETVGCYDCHLSHGYWSLPEQKAKELLVMYPGVFFRDKTGPVVETARQACLDCHEPVFSEIVGGEAIRVNHAKCAPGATCDGCHSASAHRGRLASVGSASMEDCIACHSAKGASKECTTCHVSQVQASRPIQGAWGVIHAANWEDTHGMGDERYCSSCHEQAFCAKCHGVGVPHADSFGSSHGSFAMKAGDKCYSCHDKKRFCEECHGTAMPHPAGFVKTHRSSAKSLDDPACGRCHLMTDCVACHTAHVHPGGAKPAPTGAER